MDNIREPIRDASKLPLQVKLLLGLQHLFTMSSAVLVPLTTGLDLSICIMMTGVGTLIFHFLTKGKVPAYLGSSFSYIGPIIAVAGLYGTTEAGLAYARGGILLAGVVYVITSFIIYKFGADKVRHLFPPVITGSMICAIGLLLAPTAISDASTNWPLAIVTLATVIIVNIYCKGFVQIGSVLIAIVVGYIASAIAGVVDFSSVGSAPWIGLPKFSLPKFDISAILMITPVCIATLVEHFGDVAAIGEVVRKDFYSDPGIHRTMFADGCATIFSSLVGGSTLTTYSENTGVLAVTGVWDPLVMRIAAVFAILLGFCPKFAALFGSIPRCVIGGVCICLFGFVAGTGLRTLSNVNFSNTRNLILFGIIAIISLGGATLPIHAGQINVEISGMPLAAVIAIVLNLILPKFGNEMLDKVPKEEVTE